MLVKKKDNKRDLKQGLMQEGGGQYSINAESSVSMVEAGNQSTHFGEKEG